MNLYLELFGYVGTALVLLSMMMTSVVKLRLFNTIGSVISMTYAFLSNAWPVVFLNLGLILINVWQLMKLRRFKAAFKHTRMGADDSFLTFFLEQQAEDIAQYFKNYRFAAEDNMEIYMVFDEVEPVGLLIGKCENNCFIADLDYVTKKYRDCSVASYLFAQLKDEGYSKIVENNPGQMHKQYLEKMGFIGNGVRFEKDLKA